MQYCTHPEASHPALAFGSGSPLPNLGEGLGVRASQCGISPAFLSLGLRHQSPENSPIDPAVI
jgi:hypothetical protein